MKHIGTIALLVFYALLLLFSIVQFALGNSGVIGFILSLVLLLPLIAKQSLSLYQKINDQRNWENYKKNHQSEFKRNHC